MLLLFDTVVKAKAEKKAIQPIEILPMLADAVTLIGLLQLAITWYKIRIAGR